jgi:hypothetical protein
MITSLSRSAWHGIAFEMCSPDIVQVGEDERFLQLEATGDDVFGVLVRELVDFVQGKVGLHQKLLVVWENRRISFRVPIEA